jgi:hypothetical protein
MTDKDVMMEPSSMYEYPYKKKKQFSLNHVKKELHGTHLHLRKKTVTQNLAIVAL